jgi:uncharacterized protein YndB with AHSA1/START domain
MAHARWHRLYETTVAAPPEVLFELLADMPSYGRWLPGSSQFQQTAEVEPYPVRLGSRYHDGRPGEGRSWRGSVTGFQPPGALDFHHTIPVRELRATVDVHIHYSFEPSGGDGGTTALSRWLLVDIAMPAVLRPLSRFITASFDKENRRTLAAVEAWVAKQQDDATPSRGSRPAPPGDD